MTRRKTNDEQLSEVNMAVYEVVRQAVEAHDGIVFPVYGPVEMKMEKERIGQLISQLFCQLHDMYALGQDEATDRLESGQKQVPA
jgi:hypothetical protein